MVTIRDVAERSGVSLGTVSRVLNGHPSVRPRVRIKVNDAISELGYVPNSAARSLRSARTRTLGLIVPNLESPMTVALVRGVEDAAQLAGYSLLLAESRLDPQLEATHIANLLQRRVDGLLISPLESISSVDRAVGSSRAPTVVLQLRRPRREFPGVFIDETCAIEAAVRDLVSVGHRRISFVHSAGRAGGGRQRRELFRTALASHGIVGRDDLDAVFSTSDACHQEIMGLLARSDRPTALIVGIHQFVPAALAAIRDAGLHVGRDISLVVFGDSDWARSLTPPLSAILVDQAEHAASAVSLLVRLIDSDPSAPRSVRSESTYIARTSVQATPMCERCESRRAPGGLAQTHDYNN